MNKFIIFSIFIISGCAHRGYDGLVQEVPELFPGFKSENYEKKETPQNIVYVEKNLPESEKKKEEFYEEEYLKARNPSSYHYYVPKNRVSKLSNEKSILKNWPTINTSHNKKHRAYLID